VTGNAFDYQFLLKNAKTAENVILDQHSNSECRMIERSFVRKRAMSGELLEPADIMKQGRNLGKAQVIIYSPCGEYMCCMSMNIDL